MRMLRTILDVTSTLLIIFGLLFGALFFGVRALGWTPLMVTSNSMAPKYPTGSVVYVRETEPSEIAEGDVITFYLGDQKIVATHQVWEHDTENQFFRTQGINNRDQDGNILKDAQPVPYENVVGKVVWGIPFLGFVNQLLTTPPGLYIALGVILVVVMLNIIVPVPRTSANRKKR